jgi:hypothetical protein
MSIPAIFLSSFDIGKVEKISQCTYENCISTADDCSIKGCIQGKCEIIKRIPGCDGPDFNSTANYAFQSICFLQSSACSSVSQIQSMSASENIGYSVSQPKMTVKGPVQFSGNMNASALHLNGSVTNNITQLLQRNSTYFNMTLSGNTSDIIEFQVSKLSGLAILQMIVQFDVPVSATTLHLQTTASIPTDYIPARNFSKVVSGRFNSTDTICVVGLSTHGTLDIGYFVSGSFLTSIIHTSFSLYPFVLIYEV